MEENTEQPVSDPAVLPFEVAYGTVVGGDHIGLGKNNQDGFHIIKEDDLIIGVICDGCGSDNSPHSEVGAKVGARIIANEVYQLINESDAASLIVEAVRKRVIHKLEIIARYMGETKTESGRLSRSETIKQYFLFTSLVFVMIPKRTIVFGIGDGYNAINGSVNYIEPNEGNEPTYLSYGLVNTSHEDVKFKIFCNCHTDEVSTILIGTDGLGDIVKNSERNMPGKKDLVGDLSQFWTNDFFFDNADGIRRRLFLMNKKSQKQEKDGTQRIEHGILKDDTTLIVVRRKNNGQ